MSWLSRDTNNLSAISYDLIASETVDIQALKVIEIFVTYFEGGQNLVSDFIIDRTFFIFAGTLSTLSPTAESHSVLCQF